MTDKTDDVIESLQVSMDGGFFTMRHNRIKTAMALIASQAAEIAALREALTTIAFQSTDMPGAAVGAGDGFYRGYVYNMIGTAARALSGDTPS
jgi:hypothetical protein